MDDSRSMEDLMNRILMHSCGSLDEAEVMANDGWQEYRLESHCVRFVITAKFVADGMDNEGNVLGHFEVREYNMEDC